MMSNLGALYPDQFDNYITYVTPVLEEDGVKRIGSSQFIIEYCCYKDQRNVPKRDEKGKVIK